MTVGLVARTCSYCAQPFTVDDGRIAYCSPACRLQRRRAIGRRNSGAYRQQYPDRELARQTLKNAILLGKIRRPVRCERCGAVGDVEGHHEDYTRPFFVQWLCVACHNSISQSPESERTIRERVIA